MLRVCPGQQPQQRQQSSQTHTRMAQHSVASRLLETSVEAIPAVGGSAESMNKHNVACCRWVCCI